MEIEYFDILQENNADSIQLLGENQKRIMVVVHENDYRTHDDLLAKMLGAVQVELKTDCSLCIIEDAQNISIAKFLKILPADKLFVIGMPLRQIGLQMNEGYHLLLKTEGLQILKTGSLKQIATNQKVKRALWGQMKIFFNHGD